MGRMMITPLDGDLVVIHPALPMSLMVVATAATVAIITGLCGFWRKSLTESSSPTGTAEKDKSSSDLDVQPQQPATGSGAETEEEIKELPPPPCIDPSISNNLVKKSASARKLSSSLSSTLSMKKHFRSISVKDVLEKKRPHLLAEDCQAAVEDVMYMLIFYKFSEFRVPLVPKLSRCIYNCRLEILPSKDWELESIHSIEVLEMVREHVSTVIGLRANSSVTDNWATTKIKRLHPGRHYAASILYGYFLKSASCRHQLERCLSLVHQKRLNHRNSLQFLDLLPCGIKSLVFGHVNDMQSVPSSQGPSRQEKKLEELRCYVMGFDPETLQRCAKLRSKEAAHLIERHSCALFRDEQTGIPKTDEVIMTSFSSLRRLVLEAVAFGSFLWDIEEYVDTVYKLKDN